MSEDIKQPAPAPARVGRATVAKGRTIVIPHPTEKRVVGSKGENFTPVYMALHVHIGPGAEVTLPRDEIVRLRALGYLVDPDQPPLPSNTDSDLLRQAAA